MNGRIPTSGGFSTPYTIFQGPSVGTNFRDESIRGIQSSNPVSDLFFSSFNLDLLQDAIRYRVYVESGNKTVISRQSDVELGIIMRSVYLQYSTNQPNNCAQQVKQLNVKVLEYAVPIIVRELQQYATYRQDISSYPIPLDPPKNVSSAGTKFLVLKDF